MSDIHLTPQVAQERIAEARILPNEELINGRHLPHFQSEKAVTEIMKHTGQETYDPYFDYKITEDMASVPEVRAPLEKFHDAIWEGDDSKPPFDPLHHAQRAWQRHGDFIREAPSREIFIDLEKTILQHKLDNASRWQGFPLSEDQLYERFRALQIGYVHSYNSMEASGSYYAEVNHAMVDLESTDDERSQSNVRHELFHAISAQRYVDRPVDMDEVITLPVDVTRVGYSHNPGTGDWMNEAMTQILAQIFGDSRSYHIQFDHPTATMSQISNRVILEILGLSDKTQKADDEHTYTDEKIAFLNAFADIPFSLLVNAYFIQDKDSPAPAQYSGAAAEKELWRAVKQRGGAERIKELRAIEAAFKSERPEEARERALKMKDQSQSFRTSLKRGVYGRQVARNTRKVQQGIQKAREYTHRR